MMFGVLGSVSSFSLRADTCHFRVQRPHVITPAFIQQFLVAQHTVVVERQVGEQSAFGGPHVHDLALATGIVGQQAQRALTQRLEKLMVLIFRS